MRLLTGGTSLQGLAWLDRRLSEKSTWAGAALLLASLGFPQVAERITGLGAQAIPVLTMLGAGLAAVSTKPHPLAIAPADPANASPASLMESDMSVASTLKKVLGFVAGILIPGAKVDTTNLTSSIQQELADTMGAAAKDLAEKLALDTTGLTGPQKVFAITEALVATAVAQGVQADIKIIEAVALDVAQAAYRATIANLESGLIALGSSITSIGGLKPVTELVVAGIEVLTGIMPASAPIAAK